MTTAVRLFAVVLLIAVQSALAAHLAILGVAPDLPLIAVMLAAFGQGPVRGGLFGLGVGLALDVLRGDRIGLFALAAGVAGWLCGEAAARVDPARASVRWLVAAGAAGIYGMVIVVCSLLLDRGEVDVVGALRHVAIAALYDGTLAALAYWPVARRAQGPVLPARAHPESRGR